MKYLFLFIAILGFQFGFSQEKKKQIVEVACGQCQLKMKQKKGCGEIKGDKFVVSYFKLLPESTKK